MEAALGCSSTILKPLTEIECRKGSNGQKARFVDHSSILSSDKTWEQWIIRVLQWDINIKKVIHFFIQKLEKSVSEDGLRWGKAGKPMKKW